jgi:polysaccharide pyruvyl transferase WcaK-like protein
VKYVCPRVIRGNRGDLLSRYGILSALYKQGIESLTVFCHKPEDIQGLSYPTLPYGGVHNLIPTRDGLARLSRSDVVLWTAGLDLQDDSSLTKLLHQYCVMLSYRMLGLKICAVAQGAGPLASGWGRFMARQTLNLMAGFQARDPGTLALLESLNSKTQLALGYDGIFLGDFDVDAISHAQKALVEQIAARKPAQPLIGFNIRQWFHFSARLLPYQYARQLYLSHSEAKMGHLIQAAARLIRLLRQKLDARLVCVSSYEPGVEAWEDDLPWLMRIKTLFEDDSEVIVVDQGLSLMAYGSLISHFNLMIGMRLHSTLVALRFGVPSINLSYTAKGLDIFRYLGLEDCVFDVEDFISDPTAVYEKAASIVDDSSLQNTIVSNIARLIPENERLLGDFLSLTPRND